MTDCSVSGASEADHATGGNGEHAKLAALAYSNKADQAILTRRFGRSLLS